MNTRDLCNAYEHVEARLNSVSSPGILPGLETVEVLCEALGRPQSFPAIHIAGTNGKGSTAAYLASMLAEGGYKTALYTSPHLLHAGERLLINGEPLAPERWMKAADAIATAIEGSDFLKHRRPTYFEVFTAAAFLLIQEEKVQAAVIETGMGGRLDATNLLSDCRLSVITPIGMDHMEYLGTSLSQIASEKFGIIHSLGSALFIGGDSELNGLFHSVSTAKRAFGTIFEENCRVDVLETSRSGNVFRMISPDGSGIWREPLLGIHQPQNAALALRAMELLQYDFPCSREARQKGLEKTQWPGRLELIAENPDIMLDGAHNPHGMRALAASLNALYGVDSPITVVYATMSDKKYMESLEILLNSQRAARLICTEVPNNPRSETAAVLAKKASALPWRIMPEAVPDYLQAAKTAMQYGDPVLFCGSLYFIGMIRQPLIDHVR